MERSLTRRDKKQISQWIGNDSQFELLYKISRDGGSAETFHELCDNKGPTVTMFYNTDNNVYGGYLADSWESTGNWCTDQRAFLFKLYSAGNWKPVKFPYVIKETHFKNKTHGPWFYSLTSMYSFIKTTNKPSSNYYNLDTSSLFDGHRFDMKGETVQSVANGHNNVTDLEVYQVKGKKFSPHTIIVVLESNHLTFILNFFSLGLFSETKIFLSFFEPNQSSN